MAFDNCKCCEQFSYGSAQLPWNDAGQEAAPRQPSAALSAKQPSTATLPDFLATGVFSSPTDSMDAEDGMCLELTICNCI